jgi:hypothetical protein
MYNACGFSGIGMGCMLFTHSAGQGQSVLEGYPYTERPIVIVEMFLYIVE